MLLLPQVSTSTASRITFPYGLLLLVLTTFFVFVTLQFQDIKSDNDAIKFYFQSELDKSEFPLYVRFLRKHMKNEYYYHSLEEITEGKVSKIQMYWMIRTDPYFQTCLNNDVCFAPNSLAYLKWQEKRREYLRILDNNGFEQYGFNNAKPSIVNLITCAFVQASIFQFVINLLFLIFIGTLVESKLTALGLIWVYFICASMMVSSYMFLAPFSSIPLSAASGGIAGLIGTLPILYGLKKVRLFYYMKQVRFIEIYGIGILPLWILGQIALLQFTPLDSVELISQMVAMISGMMFSFIIYALFMRKPSIKTKEVKNRKHDLNSRLSDAVKEVSIFNYNGAKQILYQLLDEYPNSMEVHFQIFNIAKQVPSSEEYHNIVQKIFSLKDSSKTAVAMTNLVFKNYIRRAQPTIRFDVENFLGLLQRFRKSGYYDDSEKILKVLVKHNTDEKLSEVLAREQLLLARSYLMKNDKVQGDRLLEWLVKTFPNTESAKQVKSIKL
jgi:membrane associated rhomboid family serine protease